MANLNDKTLTFSGEKAEERMAAYVAELTRQGMAFTQRETPGGEYEVHLTGGY